jgi:hypothetical protein
MTAAYRVQSKPGQEPNKWKVEKVAEIGWKRNLSVICVNSRRFSMRR